MAEQNENQFTAHTFRWQWVMCCIFMKYFPFFSRLYTQTHLPTHTHIQFAKIDDGIKYQTLSQWITSNAYRYEQQTFYVDKGRTNLRFSFWNWKITRSERDTVSYSFVVQTDKFNKSNHLSDISTKEFTLQQWTKA